MLRDADPIFADEYFLKRSHGISTVADVWIGGEFKASLPVLDGSLTETADQEIPEVVRLTVSAASADGTSFAPAGARGKDAVVGSDGHLLRLRYDVGHGSCILGSYLITEWSISGGAIAITAVGLFQQLADYGLLAPTSPDPGATFADTFVKLNDGTLPLSIHVTNDRACPQTLAWSQDRLGAFYDLANALPADIRVDQYGQVEITDLEPWAPDLTMYESADVIVSSGDGGSRQGVTNIVVASGEDSTDPNRAPVSSIAYNTSPLSPLNVNDFGPVVAYYSSPLLTTKAECAMAGETRLKALSYQSSAIPVSCLPDPRVTFGTRIELHRADGRVEQTTVTSLALPLTAQGGAMSLTLGSEVDLS